MTTYGLSDSGFLARRAADFLATIRDHYEAETGLNVEWDDDLFLGVITAIMSIMLGDLSEGSQALYDAFDSGNAVGMQLDVIGAFRGVPRNDATYSVATCQVDGTAGKVVTQGSMVEGGGEDGKARWEVTANVVLTGAPDDVVVQAEDAGLVHAEIGDIDRIVTPIEGWDSVTNAATSTDGNAREQCDTYRARQQESLQIHGSGNVNAVRAALLDLDYMTAAVVAENDTGLTVTIGGLTLIPYSVFVILYPSTMTAAQQQEVAELIYRLLSAATDMNGTDVTATVTKGDGLSKTIRWDWATTIAAKSDYTVELEDNYVIGDVDAALKAATVAYFNAMTVGEGVQDLDLQGVATGIDGIKRANPVTIDIGAGAVTDAEPDLDELLTMIAGDVSVHL